jgi:hypothetical protein
MSAGHSGSRRGEWVLKLTRADIEQSISDVEDERAELRSREDALSRDLASLRGTLDGFCRARCDHGRGCGLERHHGGDRHETVDCVFFEVAKAEVPR